MPGHSSSTNDSLLHPNLSSVNPALFSDLYCLLTRPSSFIFTSFLIVIIFLISPVLIYIIFHGLQKYRKKLSTPSAAAMSHSDSFTYHMVTMELIGVLLCVLCLFGIYSDQLEMVLVWLHIGTFIWYGQMFFHVLTCVERYLAVVHPITYLSLRKERGIRMRNITIGCVWLLCIVGTGLREKSFIIDFSLLIVSYTVVSFCSVSVLCILIHPGPGEQGGGKERVDQSKQRAFNTIMAILGVLVTRFTWDVVRAVLFMLNGNSDCVIITSSYWFNLPSSLVLPLLLLHRAGKLMSWKKNIQRG